MLYFYIGLLHRIQKDNVTEYKMWIKTAMLVDKMLKNFIRYRFNARKP